MEGVRLDALDLVCIDQPEQTPLNIILFTLKLQSNMCTVTSSTGDEHSQQLQRLEVLEQSGLQPGDLVPVQHSAVKHILATLPAEGTRLLEVSFHTG